MRRRFCPIPRARHFIRRGLQPHVGETYGTLLGLGDEEVNNRSLNSTPNAEDDVGVPSDMLQSNGPDELVEDRNDVHDEVTEGHTLCSNFE